MILECVGSKVVSVRKRPIDIYRNPDSVTGNNFYKLKDVCKHGRYNGVPEVLPIIPSIEKFYGKYRGENGIREAWFVTEEGYGIVLAYGDIPLGR